MKKRIVITVTLEPDDNIDIMYRATVAWQPENGSEPQPFSWAVDSVEALAIGRALKSAAAYLGAE